MTNGWHSQSIQLEIIKILIDFEAFNSLLLLSEISHYMRVLYELYDIQKSYTIQALISCNWVSFFSLNHSLSAPFETARGLWAAFFHFIRHVIIIMIKYNVPCSSWKVFQWNCTRGCLQEFQITASFTHFLHEHIVVMRRSCSIYTRILAKSDNHLISHTQTHTRRITKQTLIRIFPPQDERNFLTTEKNPNILRFYGKETRRKDSYALKRCKRDKQSICLFIYSSLAFNMRWTHTFASEWIATGKKRTLVNKGSFSRAKKQQQKQPVSHIVRLL